MINPTLLETPVPHPATRQSRAPRHTSALLILTGLWLIIYFAALRVDALRYLEKPPLPYWLVAFSFRLFGFNTFAAHLPQAIGVLLLTLLGYLWAGQAFSARTAFYTGLATLTSVGVFLFTRYFIPEILLSLFLCTALYCFLQSLKASSLAENPGAPYLDSEMWAFARSTNRTPPIPHKSVIPSEGGAFA